MFDVWGITDGWMGWSLRGSLWPCFFFLIEDIVGGL